jgi:hypothetical protein
MGTRELLLLAITLFLLIGPFLRTGTGDDLDP